MAEQYLCNFSPINEEEAAVHRTSEITYGGK